MKSLTILLLSLLGLGAIGGQTAPGNTTTTTPPTVAPVPAPASSSTPSSSISSTVPQIIAAKLPAVLKSHQIPPNSKLVDLKPALVNVTKLAQCYEVGIVGKDERLNIYDNTMTVEAIVAYYFEKLPNVINVQNAELRIGSLIHSMKLITDEVIDCDRLDRSDKIGLTPFSCLPIAEQTAMIG